MSLGEAKLEIQNLRCSLGEGAHWDMESETLYFVDVLSQKIYTYNPESTDLKSKDVDSPPGCVIPTDDIHKCVVCTQKSIQVIALDESITVLLMDRSNMENKESNRFNDGKVDPAGRLWVGTMASNRKGNEGSLFCITNINNWTPERTKIGSNGMAWSNDSRTMYYIDSAKKKVRACDYDNNTGKIYNDKTAFKLKDDKYVLDGMTIDSEDFLWIAIWGGERVIRVNPATGKEVAQVRVPAKNVTSCCFGGPNLTTLYITTAAHETDTSLFPLAGGVFSFETNVVGTPMNRYSLVNLELLCLERAESSITSILDYSSKVTHELSRFEADRTGDSIKENTQQVLKLCQSIRQDMRVPLHGLTESFHFTNNMSIYGPRKDMEMAHRRSLLIYESLLAMKSHNNPNDNNDFNMDEDMI
jgi:sugar lactone lactonase YvrE